MSAASEFPSMGATLFFGLTATALVLAGQPGIEYANPLETMSETEFSKERSVPPYVHQVSWPAPPLLGDAMLVKFYGALSGPTTAERGAVIVTQNASVPEPQVQHHVTRAPRVLVLEIAALRDDARLVRDLPGSPQQTRRDQPAVYESAHSKPQLTLGLESPALPEPAQPAPNPRIEDRARPSSTLLSAPLALSPPPLPEPRARQHQTQSEPPSALLESEEPAVTEPNALALVRPDMRGAAPKRADHARPKIAAATRPQFRIHHPMAKPRARADIGGLVQVSPQSLDLTSLTAPRRSIPAQPEPLAQTSAPSALPSSSHVPQSARITGDAVTLHARASDTSQVLKTYEWGAFALISETRGNWARVTAEGATGWMRTDRLTTILSK